MNTSLLMDKPKSPTQRAWARFKRNRYGYVSLWIFIFVLMISTLGELVSNDRPLIAQIDGKTYFVDGAKLDDHGDAHAEDGFCATIRKAEVVGAMKDDRFVASYFKLLPLKEGK